MDNETSVSTNQTAGDSAYSNSCSNQSRSQRSGSTVSGSHSSGSSGYGGKHTQLKETSSIATSSSQKWEKEKTRKKKKIKTSTSSTVANNSAQEQNSRNTEVIESNENEIKRSQNSPQWQTLKSKGHTLNPSIPESFQEFENPQQLNELESINIPSTILQPLTPKQTENVEHKIDKTKEDLFRCVISMHDGMVLFTTPNITDLLGFPKDMWLGRSFIDFVHPKDRAIFANQISIAIPIAESKTSSSKDLRFSLHVMLRKYRGLLSTGYNVTGKSIEYAPFWINLTFKDVPQNTKADHFSILNDASILLVISAVPIKTPYKTANELVNSNNLKFSVRHSAAGIISQIDGSYATAVGYFSQNMIGKSILDFYCTDDLQNIRNIYEQVIQKSAQPGLKYFSKPYQFLIKNGNYIKLETEWTSFINPWTRKLEFIIGNHKVIQGPEDCDIFKSNPSEQRQNSQDSTQKSNMIKDEILNLLSQCVERPTDTIKQEVSKRCQDLATFMENLMEEVPNYDLKLDMPQETDLSMSERGTVMLGEISPHHDYYCDSKSSSETPPSYNQLNYNENLQRFFNSKPITVAAEEQQSYNENSMDQSEIKSPIHCSGDSGGSSNLTSESSACPDQAINFHEDDSLGHLHKLTEVLLQKHNEEMEKNMLKKHREVRSRFGDKIKKSQEKQEQHNHGIKRSGSFTWEGGEAYKTTKQHILCDGPRDSLEANNIRTYSNSRGIIDKLSFQQFSRNIDLWPPFSVSLTTMQTSQVPTNSQFVTAPRLVYYFPQNPSVANTESKTNETKHSPQITYPLQCMTRFMYSHPQVFYAQPANNMYQPMPIQTSSTKDCLDFPFQSKLLSDGVASKNQSQSAHSKVNQWQKDTEERNFKTHSNATSLKAETGSSLDNSSNKNQFEDTDESSYSSFYSSFIKTDGSSTDAGPNCSNQKSKQLKNNSTAINNRVWRRQEPPWLNNVAITSELIYNYQLKYKNLTDVLKNDLTALKQLKQPILVNDQLNQLYLDLELEGISAKLYLTEPSSDNSSDDDHDTNYTMNQGKNKRNYMNSTMIFEENCPLPSSVN